MANQPQAVVDELSDKLAREFKTIVIEVLNVKGMVKNCKLARAVSDASFGMPSHRIQGYSSRCLGQLGQPMA